MKPRTISTPTSFAYDDGDPDYIMETRRAEEEIADARDALEAFHDQALACVRISGCPLKPQCTLACFEEEARDA